MYVQYTVYEGKSIAFVESTKGIRSIPSVGDVVNFPYCEDARFSRVIDIIWYVYRDDDPLVEVVCQVCVEPKCREPQVKA